MYDVRCVAYDDVMKGVRFRMYDEGKCDVRFMVYDVQGAMCYV